MKYWHSFNVVATSTIKNTTYSISLLSFYFLGKCISENLLNLADCLGLIANLIAYNYNVPVYKRVFKKYLMGSRTPIVGSLRTCTAALSNGIPRSFYHSQIDITNY